MLSNRLKREMNWFSAGIVMGALAIALLPVGELGARSAQRDNVGFRSPITVGGHGEYCRVPGRGVYFYGRDFDPESGSDRAFARWCANSKGELGWVE